MCTFNSKSDSTIKVLNLDLVFLNEKVREAISTLNKIVDKHEPIKLASQSKQRQLNKPWLNNGILKSVKRKQKMYRTHFKDL